MSKAAFLSTILIMSAVTSGMMSALPLTLRGIPDKLINLPNREYWLTPERRAAAHARLAAHLAWLGCATAIFMAFALELTLQANLRAAPLDHTAMMIGLSVFVVATLACVVTLSRAFRIPE